MTALTHPKVQALAPMLSVVAGLLALSEAARASCVFEEPAELTAADIIELQLAPVSVLEAPRSGLWWLPRPIDDFDEQCTDVVFRAADDSTVDLELVREGPRVLALRVPSTLEVGTVLRLNAVCAGEPTQLTSLRVIDGTPPEREAPNLAVEQRSLFDWIEPACNDAGQNLPDTHRFATLLSLSAETEADELLLDVWLVGTGDARPSEDAARAADASAWTSSARTLLVRDPGNFDLHARLTDPATGATSAVVVERVATPEPQPVQCGSAPFASAPVLGLAVLFLGFLVPRPARHRRRHAARPDRERRRVRPCLHAASLLWLGAVIGCEPPLVETPDGGQEAPETPFAESWDACPGLDDVVDGFLPGSCTLDLRGFSAFLDAGATVVEGRLNLRSLTLREIELPSLERAGNLIVGGNRFLESLSMPAFEEGNISIGPNELLSQMSVPALRSGSVFITLAPLPDGVHLPGLEEAGTLQVAATNAPTIDAPLLRSVGEALIINENSSLSELQLPSLVNVTGRVEVIGNVELAQCLADALVGSLSGEPNSVESRANLDGCDCATTPPTCE